MRVSHVKLAAQSLIDVCCPYILSAYKKRQSSGYDFSLLRVVNHSVCRYLAQNTMVMAAVIGVIKSGNDSDMAKFDGRGLLKWRILSQTSTEESGKNKKF